MQLALAGSTCVWMGADTIEERNSPHRYYNISMAVRIANWGAMMTITIVANIKT